MSKKVFTYPITDVDTIEDFIKHPLLWALTHGDEDPDLWDPELDRKSYYLIRYSEGEWSGDVGIIETYPFTEKVVIVHFYVDPAYWGEKVGYMAAKAGIKMLQEQGSKYTSALVKVGKPHVHVQLLLKDLGFKCIAKVDDAVICNGETTDLFLFQLKFNKEEEE